MNYIRVGTRQKIDVILSEAKDLTLAAHSISAVRVWLFGGVLRLRLRTTWTFLTLPGGRL